MSLLQPVVLSLEDDFEWSWQSRQLSLGDGARAKMAAAGYSKDAPIEIAVEPGPPIRVIVRLQDGVCPKCLRRFPFGDLADMLGAVCADCQKTIRVVVESEPDEQGLRRFSAEWWGDRRHVRQFYASLEEHVASWRARGWDVRIETQGANSDLPPVRPWVRR